MATQTIEAGVTTLASPAAAASIYVVGGNASIVTNMDYSAANQITMVDINPEFTGQFGTSAAPFTGSATGTFRYAAQGGSAYWISNSADSDTSPRLLMPMGTGGHLHLEAGGSNIVTSAECASGKLTIATGAVVTNLYLGSGSDCRLYDDSSTDPTIIVNSGGVLYCDRGATTLTHNGGVTWIQGPAANAITTLNVNGRGCVLKDSGTISTANLFGGLPDVSGLKRTLTISQCNINMSLPGAATFLDHHLITFSATTKYLG